MKGTIPMKSVRAILAVLVFFIAPGALIAQEVENAESEVAPPPLVPLLVQRAEPMVVAPPVEVKEIEENGEDISDDQLDELLERNMAGEEAEGEMTDEDESPVAIESRSEGEADSEKRIFFEAAFQTALLYQNDSDFDSTEPAYNPNGQSVGLLGTFLKPRLTLVPIKEIKIVYEAELGLNLWGRNDPDQYRPGEDNAFQLAHRELYAQADFVNNLFGFKVGYQYFQDPTALFLGHWLGAGNFYGDLGWTKLTLTVAQMPDQTYEGISADSNNFTSDCFIYGLRADFPFDHWLVVTSFYVLEDRQIVKHPMNLFAPSLSVSGNYGWTEFGLDLVFQNGRMENGSVMGDEDSSAWAMQAYADFLYKGVEIRLNQLVLSPDDRYDRNQVNHGFFYSGKSRSRTHMLSEDEIRDWGNNLDERIGEKRSNEKFTVMRPGYSLTDVEISYNIEDIFRPALVIGAGFALEDENVMGGRLIGLETDLDFELKYKEVLSFHLLFGVLSPGKAASVALGQYNMDAVNMQYTVETSLSVYF